MTLRRNGGQYELSFSGPWAEVTLWEIPALAIINEMRSRAALKGLGRFQLDVIYARAKAKLWSKVERLRTLPELRISDFGTRRRHSFLWQRWCVEALKEGLGLSFTGTSNVLLAMDNDLEALGTNAHELPMVLATRAKDDDALRKAPYQMLADWQKYYGGNLLIVLPDTFGTKPFLRDAPDWVADWTGFRPDSAPPIEGGEALLAWWRSRGRDPRDKLLVFLRCARCRHDRNHLRAFPGQGSDELRLGHQPHQRFRRLRPDPQWRAQGYIARLQGHERGRPAGRETIR